MQEGVVLDVQGGEMGGWLNGCLVRLWPIECKKGIVTMISLTVCYQGEKLSSGAVDEK